MLIGEKLMKGLLAYVFGVLLINVGAVGLGVIIFGFGIVIHWKWWLVGAGSFIMGIKLS